MTPTPYVKQAWIDADNTKPVSAARLGVIESGIFDAHYRPCVAVYASGTQSIPNATDTILLFDSELYDTDSMHSTVTNTGRLTAPVAGKYHITGRATIAASATGVRQLQIRVNGTLFVDFDQLPGSAAGTATAKCGRSYLLAAGDYVELVMTQNSGGALSTSGGVNNAHFEMHNVSY